MTQSPERVAMPPKSQVLTQRQVLAVPPMLWGKKRRTLEKQQIIGRASAVAQIGRWEFSEYFAWPAWLFVHLLLPRSPEYAEHVGDEKNQ